MIFKWRNLKEALSRLKNKIEESNTMNEEISSQQSKNSVKMKSKDFKIELKSWN